MRAGMENWLLGHWYSTGRPPWFLRMLEPVYRTAFQRAQKKGNSGAARYRSELPLIVVGNITAGGSGKTPLVIRLCQLAMDLTLKPGIASTGYGRLGTDTIVVDPGCDPRVCGDEPVMLARRTGVPVVVAKHRIDAIKKLNELDLDLIFSDDGLQQADLERDIEFCVVDGSRGLGNGHLLPAGPLRETVGRLEKVDYVITNGVWTCKPDDADVNVMHLEANQVCSLDGATVIPVTQFRQRQGGIGIHAIAGIGNPQRFFKTLKSLGIEAVPHRFPDHHPFTLDDFNSISAGSAIIMTEKDAVKCRSLGLENSWYIPVETHLPDDFENMFKDRLTKLIKERK
jgi:tetraacyldisaccharide 4'-kinase